MRSEVAPPKLCAKLIAVTACLLATVLLWPAVDSAKAERPLLSQPHFAIGEVPGGGIEGACGATVAGPQLFISDYYHHAVDVFSVTTGGYLNQFSVDSICGLASSLTGIVYGNYWHRGVGRVNPSSTILDSGESTGVAVEQGSGVVYVDDRTYIAAYEPSGAPVMREGQPLRIGVGTLGDAYGLAAFGGTVYAADAASGTIKAYSPATDPVNPFRIITGASTPLGRFNSLVEAALAVDPANGHLLMVDNLQPGYEHPEAVINEFDSSGAFLGQVSTRIIDGEPSGLAFGGGKLFVTSGNDEGSEILTFGPFSPAPLLASSAGALDSAPPTPGSSPFLAAAVGPVSDSGRETICQATAPAKQLIRGGIESLRRDEPQVAAGRFGRAARALHEFSRRAGSASPGIDRRGVANWIARIDVLAKILATTSEKLKSGGQAGESRTVLRRTVLRVTNVARSADNLLPADLGDCRLGGTPAS